MQVSKHHPLFMRGSNKVSSDYFYAARGKLQNYFLCPVMLLQGAAGDVKPAGVDKILGGTISDLARISDILVNSAKRLHFEMEEVESLQMYEKGIDYLSDVPSKAEAEKIADDAKRLCGIDGSDWLKECDRLRKAGIATQVQKEKVQFFYLNGGCVCGVPEEIFCEISLEASKRAQAPYLFLNAYTNGCTGYLPHSAEWVKGGYETLFSYLEYYRFHGHVLPFRQNTAEQIIRLVCGEWERMRNNDN